MLINCSCGKNYIAFKIIILRHKNSLCHIKNI